MATSYSNPGGSGDRQAVIALALLMGDLYNSPTNKLPLAILDGVKTGTDTTAWSFVSGSVGNGMIFDFGPTGFKQIIDEFTWYQSNTTGHGTWEFAGSDDLTTWTVLKTGFNLVTAATSVIAVTNSTAYRYYRLMQLTGTASNSPWCEEIEFKLEAGAAITEPVTVWETGDRTARITVTTNGTKATGASVGTIDKVLNGVTNTSTNEFVFASGQSGIHIDFDFGVPTIVSNARSYAQNTSADGAFWKWQGSNDASTWTDLGPSFRWRLNGSAGVGAKLDWPWMGVNRTAYRYYRLTLVTGTTSGSVQVREIEFKEALPASEPEEPTGRKHGRMSSGAFFLGGMG